MPTDQGKSLELRGRLLAVTAYVESATALVLADLKGPDYGPPSHPSGESIAIEIAAAVRALTRDIRSAAAGKPLELDTMHTAVDAIGFTVRRIEVTLRALDLGGGPAGDLVSALDELIATIVPESPKGA